MSLASRILGTIMFDRVVIEDIKVSTYLKAESLLLILIAWLCGVAASYLSSGGVLPFPLGSFTNYLSTIAGQSILTFSLTNPLLGLVFGFIFQVIFTLTWLFIATVLGNIFVGERASFWEILRCLGYSYILSVLQLIPSVLIYLETAVLAATLLSLIITLWAIGNTIYVLSVTLDCNIFMGLVIGLMAVLTAGIVIFLGGMIIVPIINVSLAFLI